MSEIIEAGTVEAVTIIPEEPVVLASAAELTNLAMNEMTPEQGDDFQQILEVI